MAELFVATYALAAGLSYRLTLASLTVENGDANVLYLLASAIFWPVFLVAILSLDAYDAFEDWRDR